MRSIHRESPVQPPLRFNEIKYMCQRYPFICVVNKNGFTVLLRSKIILNSSAYINTDLQTTWVKIQGITWLDYFLIKIRLRHAD